MIGEIKGRLSDAFDLLREVPPENEQLASENAIGKKIPEPLVSGPCLLSKRAIDKQSALAALLDLNMGMARNGEPLNHASPCVLGTRISPFEDMISHRE